MRDENMMSKSQKIYFFLYLFFILLFPISLYLVTTFIPEPTLSVNQNHHPFEYIDDKVFFIGLILNFGLYLYPLHIIFINKTTLKIRMSLFTVVSSFFILIFPVLDMLLNFSVSEYFPVLCYIIPTFLFPYFIIYYIKYKMYKKRD